jgi:hypothetical protein
MIRLRNNKRRHRANQKEYTADLERRLKVFQQEGVQASIEIQQSARKVAHENDCLRRLLRHVGVDEETVNLWVNEKGNHHDEGFDSRPKRPCPRKAVGGACGQANADPEDSRRDEPDGLGATTFEPPLEQASLSCPAETDPSRNEDAETAIEPSAVENPAVLSCSPSEARESHTNRNHQSFLGSVPTSDDTSTLTGPPPCKFLTHLTPNATVDNTRVHLASDEKRSESDVVDDGIPCAHAYEMLIHYATTKPKLDAVAHVLEGGCVPNEGPGGGCRVKSKTLWKALDDICL